jgi:hypothetical protein
MFQVLYTLSGVKRNSTKIQHCFNVDVPAGINNYFYYYDIALRGLINSP